MEKTAAHSIIEDKVFSCMYCGKHGQRHLEEFISQSQYYLLDISGQEEEKRNREIKTLEKRMCQGN